MIIILIIDGHLRSLLQNEKGIGVDRDMPMERQTFLPWHSCKT